MNILDSLKEETKKAESFAEKQQLREAVTITKKVLKVWAEKPGFWERLLGKFLVGNLVENLEAKLIIWQNQVTEADKLIAKAKVFLQQDPGNPLETQALTSAIALYQKSSKIIYDQQVLQVITQCQNELQQRQQFLELITQAESQLEHLWFKQAIAIYEIAAKLYPTEDVKTAIATARTHLPQEEIYIDVLQRAKKAESEGRLKGAIALLESAVTNFPRVDGIDLLKTFKSIYQGRQNFRQGLKLEKSGNFVAAKSCYQKAKLLLPETTNCCIRLGLVAIKMQDWETALSNLEGIPGEQAAYLRGFALAQQANLQLADREWQDISNPIIHQQKEILQRISEYQRLSSLNKIEELVKAGNFKIAKITSTEFLQKFGLDPVVESNLNEHIEPQLAAKLWQSSDWENIGNQAEKAWIENPNITTLHNWAIATYYHTQNDSKKLFELIFALSTAMANLTLDPTLQDVPWLGSQTVDFNNLSLKLQQSLEAAIDQLKDTNIQDYSQLRDRYRLELATLKIIGESGMQINNLLLTPGCYHRFLPHWENKIIDKIHPSNKILSSLYTSWGLAVAACLQGDIPRAIEVKPDSNIESEQFAQNFVNYHEGSYYLQQDQWHQAIIPLTQAKAEIQDQLNWQQELNQLCKSQRQTISEFSEHLEFAQFWYDLIRSEDAGSYLAEYKAEELRDQLINEKVSLSQALQQLKILKQIDSENPVVNDLIESVELSQELEEIERLFKKRQFAEMVSSARRSHREKVRFIVAEFFIGILSNGIKDGKMDDMESILQLGHWAYEICPDEPAFQEIYRILGLC
ncbi:peptidase M, neutral zinc metallopeptidase site [Cronbergia sp. UHCC 0137]|uniref:peptidase M, neutral zinc metallopeptidase site n=1 Tax=Cronbergia sp. UHCC 0137 TaxID=3110239 RepID=UPI002B211BA6|nr:peptidase M, neutral zinc metallopeptidase site [Cronbergia sp. UHCC 0137]MEA5619817.1 peptidase M, neutral zinc metallopeptidase site [Cronbergia sp. UHCC 0137]